MSPWLVVTGTGSWTSGRRYGPGVHEISEEVAERARRFLGPERKDRARAIIVMDERPVLRGTHGGGPLTMEDIARGVTEGVQVAVPESPDDQQDAVLDLAEVPRDHVCEWCPYRCPSSGALKRHVEFRHAVGVQETTVAAAEVEEEETPGGFPLA